MGLLRPETESRIIQIPDGVAGVDATLAIMSELVHQYQDNDELRAVARDIISVVPSKSYSAEARMLFYFVRDEIRYTRDPNRFELVQSPDKTLAFAHGDCDDMSVLLATLLESVGHHTRFFAAGFNGGPIEHVWVETKIGGRDGNRWFAMDATERGLDFGQRPSGITETVLWTN
jgi:transglutaminase-like putative cysteine protease